MPTAPLGDIHQTADRPGAVRVGLRVGQTGAR